MSLALYFFWLLPIPVLAAIATLMYRRKQHHSYLAFWIYICFQFGRLVAEVIAYLISYKAFRYCFWTAGFASVIFTLVLLRSIFVTVLRDYSSIDKVRRHGYEVALGILWITGLLITFYTTSTHTLMPTITRAGQAVSFTSVGMFLFVVLASRILGIKWNSAVCGIAAGLGLMGTIDVVFFLYLSRLVHSPLHSYSYSTISSWVGTVGYDAAIAIFAVYFLPVHSDDRVPQVIRPELVDWAQSMKGALSK